ncbi:MAG TPA: transcription termination/antitermination NusG family protein [Candidatus Angelobacter sp.]|nr:transcription termination/antitermination NusG family protein [Candidatus Angelobacter sp.]
MNSLSWYAIRTKPRQEERAVENLTSWGITTLAPRLEGSNSQRDSQLFPGYIFARFEGLKTLHNIHFTRGVAYVVSFGGVPAPISDEVIGEIYARMDENGVIRNTTALNPGDEVIIQSGLLRDFVGVFERELPGTKRVQILLSTVAYSVHVEVPRLEVARAAISPRSAVS